jgi:hypothetical protein
MSKKSTLILILMVVFCGGILSAQNNAKLWTRADQPSQAFKENAGKWASKYFAFNASPNEVLNYLEQSPALDLTQVKSSSFVFSVPMPDGKMHAFRLINSPVMESGLAAKYPGITTYAGQGIDDATETMRCDVTQWGFHAIIIGAGHTVYIDPVDRFNPIDYISYYKRDALRQDEGQVCLNTDDEHDHSMEREEPATANRTIQGNLRTYRLALACTGEYASFHGGTVPGALAAMVTSMNRINGVYEKEFGIHMNMIDNNDTLIFLTASSDPYTNNNGSTMLNQNQTTVNNRIGSANYDIGHVFSTGGGGIAQLGCICNNTNKAKGVTGMNAPVGDAFDIDYVAHEMGHQFGANHTFNSTAGSCGGGNRSASSAYEPGSGSTIMAYAGICTGQDLQMHSDDYFHTRSFDAIVTYTNTGTGNDCPVLTTDTNMAPVLTLPGNFTIPLNTPFRLTASATDPDGDAITYCWEEWDLGAAGNWNAPSGNAPIFRSFLPTTSGTRLFPKLLNILNNNTTIGEIKPSYARVLNFRCTVRDNVIAGAGVTYNDVTTKVTVTSTGPFEITSQNTVGIKMYGSTVDSVTWLVGGSDIAPISTPNVNVLLSLDGGYTWPYTLGTNVPNIGSYHFTVPVVSTSTARIMVEGAGNIFFDINNKNFTIDESVGITSNQNAGSVSLSPNPTTGELNLAMINDEKGRIDVVITDITGKVMQSVSLTKNGSFMKHSLSIADFASGIYFVQINGANSKFVKKIIKN